MCEKVWGLECPRCYLVNEVADSRLRAGEAPRCHNCGEALRPGQTPADLSQVGEPPFCGQCGSFGLAAPGGGIHWCQCPS